MIRRGGLSVLLACALLGGGCTSEPEEAVTGGADDAGAAVESGAAGGGENVFVEACIEVQGFSRPVCECIAARAEDELSDDARAFVIASLRRDRDEIKRLQDALTMEDALAAGKFMASAPDHCPEEAG